MTGRPPYRTAFPYRFAGDGMTARTTPREHVSELLEQLLFTRVGERLMRPSLGTGIPDLLFGPVSDETAAAAELSIQVAIQEFLSRDIELLDLSVRAENTSLLIDIAYRILQSGEEAEAAFRTETGVIA